MALGEGSLIEVVVNQVHLAQQTLNVWQYEITDYIATPSAVQIAEAYWNHVKAVYRALASSALAAPFISIKLRELNNPVGDYAEFDIPTAERTGTRTPPSGDIMPPNLATGVRLVVGTRATRPGQKRVPYMYEADQASGVNGAAWITLVNSWATTMTAAMTLGAPAALTILQPIITRKDASGNVLAHQNITGFITATNNTTQNTRKIGRGA